MPGQDLPPAAPRGTASMIEERPDLARARAGLRDADHPATPHSNRTLFGAWREFARRYGWRAYALPVLVVLTITAMISTHQVPTEVTAARHPGGGPTTPPMASGSISLKDDHPAGAKINDTALKAAALPPGAPYALRGTGTFRVLKGTSPKVGTGRLFRYSVEVENGIDDIDLDQYQHVVVSTLSDPRSWARHGVAVERVDSGPVDFHLTLVSAMTVRKLCGYTIPVETSCYLRAGDASAVNRVVINDARWVRGSPAYVGDPDAYRVYMINHESGHALGHNHAHQCLPGGLAPVMMEQTFGLRSARTGALCQANPWPYPPGAKGTPGAEQPDTAQNDEYSLGD